MESVVHMRREPLGFEPPTFTPRASACPPAATTTPPPACVSSSASPRPSPRKPAAAMSPSAAPCRRSTPGITPSKSRPAHTPRRRRSRRWAAVDRSLLSPRPPDSAPPRPRVRCPRPRRVRAGRPHRRSPRARVFPVDRSIGHRIRIDSGEAPRLGRSSSAWPHGEAEHRLSGDRAGSNRRTVYLPLAQQTPNRSPWPTVRSPAPRRCGRRYVRGSIPTPPSAISSRRNQPRPCARVPALPRRRIRRIRRFRPAACRRRTARGVSASWSRSARTSSGYGWHSAGRPADIVRIVAAQAPSRPSGTCRRTRTCLDRRALAFGAAVWSYARDPLTLAVVSVVLALAAAIATIVPARRAARADPLAAVRQE